MRLLLAILLPAVASAAVTVTPFCKNSVRVQIMPPSDNDTRAAQADLRATLDAPETELIVRSGGTFGHRPGSLAGTTDRSARRHLRMIPYKLKKMRGSSPTC